MSEFSDKYKCAMESREISPDFKERTAEKMKKLRDAAPAPRKNITLYRVVSAAAAAAACLTAGFALNKTGVFDSDSQPPVVEEQTTSAYVTAAESNFPEEPVPEALQEVTLPTEAILNSYAEEESPAADNAAPAEETVQTTTAPVTAVTAAESAYTQDAAPADVYVFPETSAETLAAVPTEETPTPVVTSVMTSAENVIDEIGLSSYLVLEPAPDPYADRGGEEIEEAEEEKIMEEAAEEIAEDEYEQDGAGETGIGGGDMYGSYETFPVEAVPEEDEDTPTATGAYYAESTEMAADTADGAASSAVVSEIIKASEFSAGDTMSAFKASDCTAVITPAFEDFDPESGSVVIYKPKKIRNVKKLMELSGKLCEYARDGEASLKTAAPSDSRYIIDYRSKQGDAVRVCVGSRYISFAYKGGYYSFSLTDDEYTALNDALFAMIK